MGFVDVLQRLPVGSCIIELNHMFLRVGQQGETYRFRQDYYYRRPSQRLEDLRKMWESRQMSGNLFDVLVYQT